MRNEFIFEQNFPITGIFTCATALTHSSAVSSQVFGQCSLTRFLVLRRDPLAPGGGALPLFLCDPFGNWNFSCRAVFLWHFCYSTLFFPSFFSSAPARVWSFFRILAQEREKHRKSSEFPFATRRGNCSTRTHSRIHLYE